MRVLLALLMALAALLPATAATNEDDVAHYVAIFNGPLAGHDAAVEELGWKGISDTRVFDIIEQRLLADAEKVKFDWDGKNRVGRYFRALGFSGQGKYEPTLNKYANDHIYGRYAKTALHELPLHRAWNPVISNRVNFDSAYSDDVNRVRNMLRSPDLELKKVGAKRVYFAQHEEVLTELVAADLKTRYLDPAREDVDAVAWMVKALGRADPARYRALIEDAAFKSRNDKIARHAKKALGM